MKAKKKLFEELLKSNLNKRDKSWKKSLNNRFVSH